MFNALRRGSREPTLPALHLANPRVEEPGDSRYLVGLAIRATTINTGPVYAISPAVAVEHPHLKFEAAPLGDLAPNEVGDLLIRVIGSSTTPPGQSLLGDFTIRTRYRDGEGRWRETVTPGRLGGTFAAGGLYDSIGVAFDGATELITPFGSSPRASATSGARRVLRPCRMPRWAPGAARWLGGLVVSAFVAGLVKFTIFDTISAQRSHEATVAHVRLSRSSSASSLIKTTNDQGRVAEWG